MIYKYQNLYENLEVIVKANPKSVAIFEDNKKISYKELKNKIDKVGAYLENAGIRHGDKVGILITNSQEFIISYYAITAIGAVAVPLNTFLKSDEIKYILKDCEAKALFLSTSFQKELQKVDDMSISNFIWAGGVPKTFTKTDLLYTQSCNEDTESLYLENETDETIKHICFEELYTFPKEIDFVKKPILDDLCHIIYTSGTTGKPKGAMITYKNIFSNVVKTSERFKASKKDRFVVFLPMFHSFTLTLMVILPLCYGSSIILVKSVFPFSNVLKQTLLKRATIFLGVPAIYTAIGKAKIPWYFKWFNNVRLFVCGAAPLAKQTIDDFSAKFPRASLVEGYGLSECSPVVASNLYEKQKPLSVGIPLDGYKVKIVNDEMVEIPIGQVGEIIVKGDCVMKGYYGMDNSDVIINGWLRTGDLGKIDEDGFIYIVDRKKDLIISKGINIYPREIEEVIYQLEEVEAAAVIGVSDEHADEEVVAFVQLKEGMNIDEKYLKKYLKKYLANFKIPKNIYFSEELPRNATGKVLKRVLKEQLKDKI
ncbi:long-chain-fatty-acid--CoA ligase/synthetase [Campylobacter pinnipediorum subsp. caledonicus]|uniref:Long-chain-fatty-acid--CoA ligase n=1 Tax=Campylobacter pinnipediorum subsp. caledonicus TaxID=1874362 RepID=A0A1S6U9R3_9BACT|nr:long-chain-fatty-acid--CoA ligase [Campylobacter pinnipediorum]AQW86757.1 long-chain-fatty-acid--CoA ligase/synthetase [Campylobacter pinnipediorum subsp. caledonicus]AQW88412.1 long-chain-fatty-acid--CoA ligase/synthetase [Campylobacter pinnipediorum subsp. caledonicus]OPA72621.1 long-chain fatty acid--CoA ligase [Campylobacter pinnipediorum subsp. caledonicus]